jgi:hypothetical protein
MNSAAEREDKRRTKWNVKSLDENYFYIYSGDDGRPYMLTAVRSDVA